jgi:homocysteine S-methyltransferase
VTEDKPGAVNPERRSFEELLARGAVIFDGAMGTELYSRGVFINRCFDELVLSDPDMVREVHRAYLQAGVDVIETNSFGANRFKLEPHGFQGRVRQINRRAAELAREVSGGVCLVAGSIGPLGLRIEPWGPTSMEEAEEAFHEQVEALLEGGVDLLILETFSDLNEIRQAIKATHQLCSLPIVAQMTLEEDGNSLYGTQPEIFTSRLDEWGADVVGCNCSVGPQVMLDTLERMARVTRKPLAAQPNAGMPRNVEGRNIYLASPDYFGSYARRFVRAGARVVGGCCGTNPEHIKAIRRMVRSNRIARPRQEAGAPALVAVPAEVRPVPRRQKSGLAKAIAEGRFVICAELHPPRGVDVGEALGKARSLHEHGVDAVFIPDGPRASARMGPTWLAVLIEREVGVETVLHYICRDRNLLGMQADLLGASATGLHNLLIITGDPPKTGDYPDATGVFDVDAIGLTNVVDRLNHGLDIGGNLIGRPTAFHIGVHFSPGAPDLAYEIRRFEYKVEAGAEFATTPPVFDVDPFKDSLKRVSHSRIPILAGLVPLGSLRQAEYLNNEVAGCHVPDAILDRMRQAEEAGTAPDEGRAIAGELLEALRPLVQGVHLGGSIEQITRMVGA